MSPRLCKGTFQAYARKARPRSAKAAGKAVSGHADRGIAQTGRQTLERLIRFLEDAFVSLGARGRSGEDTVPGADVQAHKADSEIPYQELHFTVRSRTSEVALIALRNALFNILTLTMYRFWGRTRVRRYLWSRTFLMDEPLEYTGRGFEIFAGFVLTVIVLVVPLISISISLQLFVGPGSPFAAIYAFVIYVGVFFFYGVANYRAHRYRLSRTLWRGIRCGLKGSWIVYGAQTLVLSYLTLFSLFWTYPIQRFVLMKQLMAHTTFGDRQFRFEGTASKLYPSFAVAWLLSIVGLYGFMIALFGGLSTALEMGLLPIRIDFDKIGAANASPQVVLLVALASLVFYALVGLVLAITMTWYRAQEFRYFAQCTRLDGLRFHFRTSGLSMLWLGVGNSLILLFSFGFALPLAQMRTFKYFFSRLTAEGAMDIDSVRQGDSPYPLIGEGLAEFFEVGSV